MQCNITGTTVPAIQCILDKNEAMYTQKGGMAWMTEGIKVSTNLKNGLGKSLGRKIVGETSFMTTYTAIANNQLITFASTLPGSVQQLTISQGNEFICQKNAFLCAQNDVKLSVCFTKKVRAGIFGGDGLVLEKLSGNGMAFLEVAGDIAKYNLAENQTMLVDSGCLVGFSTGIDFDIKMNKGVRNVMFGGEGLFLTKLTGPGTIFLQTQNIKNFAEQISKHTKIPDDK